MTIYDASEFGAIDATAYADGKPSDTWLRRKIENNIAFLTINEPPVTVLRKGGTSTDLEEGTEYHGDRAIASWATTVFICQPVWVTPATSHIKMSLCIRTMPGYVKTGYQGPSEVFIGAIVKQSDGKEVGSLPATSFDDDRPYGKIELTTYTIPVSPTGTGYVFVMMTMRSRVDDFAQEEAQKAQDTFSRILAAGVSQLNFDGAPGKYDPDLSPTPATAYPFDHCMIENSQTDSYGDVLAFEKLSEEEGKNLFTFLDTVEEPGLNALMQFLGIRSLSYMQMRSYTVEVVNRYTLRSVELLPKVPEKGMANLRQAQSTRLLRGRPRLIAGGPEGYRPPFRYAIQGGHPQVWSSAFSGPGASPQPVMTLLKTAGIEPLSDGKIQIVMLLSGCAHKGKGYGTVDWNISATVSNWVETETATLVAPIGTVGTRDSWTQERMATSWIPAIQRAAQSRNREFYAVRDGQFLLDEFSDLTQVIIEVNVPKSGVNVGYAIVVTAQCAGNIVDVSVGVDPIDFQHLTLVGHAVYLMPREAP